MDTWKTIFLGDVIKTNTNSYSVKENWEFVNYLDTGNITENVIDNTQFIDLNDEKLPSRAKRKVKYNSIVYSTVRPNQRHYGIIKSIPPNFLVSTGFAVIDVDTKIADSDFVYFLLSQEKYIKLLHAIAEQSVSAYPSIKASDIERLEVKLPPIDIQKKIASILLAINEKIIINNDINKNLEEQAFAIFRSWFVDFKPSGGTIPENWNMSTLSTVSEIGAGGDKPPIVSEQFSEDCPYPIYSNGISNEGLYGYTDNAKIFDESVSVSARGTIGFVCLRHIPYVPIVRLITLIPDKQKITAKYLYCWLKSIHIAGTGTTQQQLTVPQFKSTEILVPDANVMTRFTDITDSLFNKIWSNQDENMRLASLRDTLLPRLISGVLDVSDIDI